MSYAFNKAVGIFFNTSSRGVIAWQGNIAGCAHANSLLMILTLSPLAGVVLGLCSAALTRRLRMWRVRRSPPHVSTRGSRR